MSDTRKAAIRAAEDTARMALELLADLAEMTADDHDGDPGERWAELHAAARTAARARRALHALDGTSQPTGSPRPRVEVTWKRT
jgi:hypothetical protein